MLALYPPTAEFSSACLRFKSGKFHFESLARKLTESGEQPGSDPSPPRGTGRLSKENAGVLTTVGVLFAKC